MLKKNKVENAANTLQKRLGIWQISRPFYINILLDFSIHGDFARIAGVFDTQLSVPELVSVLDIMLHVKCLLCRDYCAFLLPIRIIRILRYISRLILFSRVHCTQCVLCIH